MKKKLYIYNNMELNELIGKEIVLVGYVKEFISQHKIYYTSHSVSIIVFKYDSKEFILKIEEDASDGYRSSLGSVRFVGSNDEEYKNNEFIYLPPAKLIVNLKDTNYREEWSFTDEFGKSWFSFGTDNIDDYYPSYFMIEPDVDLKSWREAKLNDIL